MKSKGLGDSIEKITQATGIKKVIDKVNEVTGKDCGCKKRKDKLNKLFPYNNNTKRGPGLWLDQWSPYKK